MDETITISPEECEILDTTKYSCDIDSYFSNVPAIAKPLINGAKMVFQQIEKYLYTAPSFISLVKSVVPEETFQAIITDEQKLKIAAGALKLMSKKDGSLLATLVDPVTNKIVSTIPLKSIKITPELSQSMVNYASQMQMAQLSEQIQLVQLAIEEVRRGQENDRLALAYSCQQKLLQAMAIKSPEIRINALLRVVSDAEDSRNMLMLSQKENIEIIKSQPKDDIGKVLHGANPKKINVCMSELRESLNVVNMVSLVEAMAYQSMGEMEAARQSLVYYADFINDAYLSTDGFVQRLDMVDKFTDLFWSKALPEIQKTIRALPCNTAQLLEN